MKKLIRILIDLIVWPFGKLFSAKVCQAYNSFRYEVYASFVKHRFKKVGKLRTFGIPFGIVGGEYMELGDNITISKDCRLEVTAEWYGEKYSPRLIIGNNVILRPRCHVGCINEVRIEDNVTFGERVYVTDHIHGISIYEHMKIPPHDRPLYSKGKVVIEECVSVGENCAIMPGVTIGAHSIIGANSVVTKDVPPYSIVAGVPAKVLKIVEP